MPNTIMTVDEAAGALAKMGAKAFKDHLQFINTIDKIPEKEFGNNSNGYKPGDTIHIKKPARFIPGTSFDITSTKQDIVEEEMSVTADIIGTIGVELNTMEFATKIELKDTFERVVKPAIESIAQHIEATVLDRAVDATFNFTGTPGSNTFDVDDILEGRILLNKMLCPKDGGRTLLLESRAGAAAVTARKGLFQDAGAISKQYRDGMIGRADGFNWAESELLPVHTNGNDVSFVVDGAVSTQGSTTIHVDGLTATTGTVKKGSVFTVDGVYAVHPITKAKLDFLQPFVVTADVTADGTGDADLSVSPAMYTSAGPNGLQNISAFPANDATITFKTGSASTGYQQGLAYHKSAFRICSLPLIMPKKAEFAQMGEYEGFRVAIVRDWDQNKRSMITRLDVLCAFAAVRPEWAVRYTA